MNLKYLKFKDFSLDDPFFDSLKADYAEFPQWFAKKAEERAYGFWGDDQALDGFLYLKTETDALLDVQPPLPPKARIKVGTLKINPHGTRLGERFIKKIFDHAIHAGIDEIYVTAFAKHTKLVEMFQRYGFQERATKTTPNGTELVLVRYLKSAHHDVVRSYPIVKLGSSKLFILSLYPIWHTRLLPDSILKTESADVVEDVSHTNSIHKVYLSAMRGLETLVRGDVLFIYRTSDNLGAARYRSVVTSICIVEEYRSISSFSNREDFLAYCRPYSVFTEDELAGFWASRKYPSIIRFTYNVALRRRPTRAQLVDEVGIDSNAYPGFLRLSKDQAKHIIKLGNIDESLIVD